MNVFVHKKDYFKEPSEVKTAINCAISDLYERIYSYEKQQVPFDRIFNDDHVKYDKHGNFFTFKSQKNRLQLRILYAYIFVGKVPTIVIVDYAIKKKNNKDYIKQFNNARNLNPYSVYEDSQCIMSR